MIRTVESSDKSAVEPSLSNEQGPQELTAPRAFLRRARAGLVTAFSFAVLPGVGYLYLVSGYNPTLAFLCVPFIFLATMFGGPPVGVANGIAATVSLIAFSVSSGHFQDQSLSSFLGLLLRAEFVFALTFVLALLTKQLKNEREAARIDHLTGVYNRRVFNELLKIEVERSQRYGRTFTVAYVDFDDFKRINDNYGHRVGDEVLQAATEAMRSALRKTDSVGRLGGDEFGILLPECDEDDARFVVKKVQQRIATNFATNLSGTSLRIGCSVGAVVCRGGNWTPSELVEAADGLMYAAKREGKSHAGFAVMN